MTFWSKKALAALICSLVGAVTGASAWGADGTDADVGSNTDQTCQDADVFSGKLISGICWECVTPIKVSGVIISGTSRKDTIPDGAADKILCQCEDNLGVPKFGFATSFWEPYRMIELVRQSGCSQVLMGTRLPFDKLHQGNAVIEDAIQTDTGDALNYRHYHWYAFPAMYILDMFIPSQCNPGGLLDIDIMYMSEVDPMWTYDEINFFSNPEIAMVASPLAAVACIPDGFTSNLGKPLDELFWCAGSWGLMFPTTGNIVANKTNMLATSLMTARVLYQMHRRGFEMRSYGNDAMCGGQYAEYLPKQQYRFSVFHPVAETEGNHGMGENDLFWGINRLIPVTGEDPLFLVWRWLDCCNTL